MWAGAWFGGGPPVPVPRAAAPPSESSWVNCERPPSVCDSQSWLDVEAWDDASSWAGASDVCDFQSADPEDLGSVTHTVSDDEDDDDDDDDHSVSTRRGWPRVGLGGGGAAPPPPPRKYTYRQALDTPIVAPKRGAAPLPVPPRRARLPTPWQSAPQPRFSGCRAPGGRLLVLPRSRVRAAARPKPLAAVVEDSSSEDDGAMEDGEEDDDAPGRPVFESDAEEDDDGDGAAGPE